MESLNIPSGSVVVGIDGSEHSLRALAWAGEQAALDRRPLVIIHALGTIDPYWVAQPAVDVQALKESMIRGADELVAKARESIVKTHPDLEVAVRWASGDPRHVLLEASEQADLVVVGSRGRGPVKRLLLGSVSVGLTRHARCPVAVVRPHHGEPGGRGVLVGIDASNESLHTLEHAFRVADTRGAALTVVHCFWDSDATADRGNGVNEVHGVNGVDALDAENEHRLAVAETLAGFQEKHPDVAVTVKLARGLADDVMLEMAVGMDVAVVGSSERSSLSDVLLGSVAGALVEHATCTVIVVPRR